MVYPKSHVVKGIRYWRFVEAYRENGKKKEKVVKWIGNNEKLFELATREALNINDIKITHIQDYGNIIPLHEIFSKFELIEKINKLMVKTRGNGIDIGRLTEIMVINALTVHKSKDRISDWYGETILPKLLNISSDQLYSQLFCRALDYFTQENIEILEKQITFDLQSQFKFEIKRVFYDITSVYLEGNKCPIAEYGYNRDGKRHKKQVLLGLVIVPQNKFPILYKIYRGKIKDVKTSKEVIDQLYKMYGIQDVVFIIDRGMISDEVRLEFNEAQVKYISALDEDSIEARGLILGTPRNELREITLKSGRKAYIKRIEGNIKGIRESLGIKNKGRKKYKDLDNISFIYIIGKSPEISKSKKNAYYEAVSEALNGLRTLQDELDEKFSSLVDKGRPIDVNGRLRNILHGTTRYFKIKKKKTGKKVKFIVKFKKENLRIARKIKGRFILCTSDLSLRSQEIIQGYIDKYQIEHVFRFLKTDLKIRPFWHHKENRVIAYFFISYIAYLLKSVIDYKFRKSRLELSFKDAMEEMNKLKLVTISVGEQKIDKIPESSPTQEKISKSLKINLSP